MFFLGLEEFSQGLIDEGTALVQQQQRGPSSKELFGWKMRQTLALCTVVNGYPPPRFMCGLCIPGVTPSSPPPSTTPVSG